MSAIAEDALTFTRYYFDPKTIKARCYPRSSQSSCRLSRFLGMVENVGYALGAIPCSLAYQAINIALTDGVIKLA